MQTNEELILNDLMNEKSRVKFARELLEEAIANQGWGSVQNALNDGDR